MTLKSFIISEQVRSSHADRYLRYLERYHGEVYADLKSHLIQRWKRTLDALPKPDPELVQRAGFENPNAVVEAELDATSKKIKSPRRAEQIEAGPSVKIPYTYDAHHRNKILIPSLISAARDTFNDVANKWKAIFNYEEKGQLTPWFKVVVDHDEARFQLSFNIDHHEDFKTLYLVTVDYGRPNTKSKNFDLVYLTSRAHDY